MKKTKSVILNTGKCLLVFGILFSQLSFPLNVLADEISTMDVVEKSGELHELVDVSDYTSQETDENGSNQLVETFPENNVGTLLEDNIEEQVFQSSFTIELDQDVCIIRNTLNTTISIQDLKQSLENIVKVVDDQNSEITDETILLRSGYQVTLVSDQQSEITYTLVIFGDYNDDGMVSVEDQQILLNILKSNVEADILMEVMPLLDLNQDQIFNILDVTYPIFTENTWENTSIANDYLENYLMASNEEVYVGEEIDVNYFIEGFQLDSLVGIQGFLDYDKDLLELTKIQVNGIEENVLELQNGNFSYLLAHYQQDGILITFTFKALSVGIPVISMNDIIASVGGVKAQIDVNEISTSFDILEYGKGGDVEENYGQDSNQVEQTTSSPVATEEVEMGTSVILAPVVATQVSTVKEVALSSDNYIKSLEIKGYDINFDQNIYEYSITVNNSVSALDLTIILNSDLATYYVEGNKDFKVGENTVNIVVKAEDGSTNTYSIKVNKEKKESSNTEETEKEEENNSSKTVIIILIILVIIGLIYVIFKDDEEDKRESER